MSSSFPSSSSSELPGERVFLYKPTASCRCTVDTVSKRILVLFYDEDNDELPHAFMASPATATQLIEQLRTCITIVEQEGVGLEEDE